MKSPSTRERYFRPPGSFGPSPLPAWAGGGVALFRTYWMPFFSPRRAPASLSHVIIWGVLAGLVFTQPAAHLAAGRYYALQTALLAVLLGLFYFNVGWAVPRLLYGRRLGAYLGLLAALTLTISLTHRAAQLALAGPAPARMMGRERLPGPSSRPGDAPPTPRPNPDQPGPGGPGWLNPAVLLATLLVLGLGTSVAAVQRGQREAEARHALEQEKLTAELALLKAQLNPHFFFNTLNNIYALTQLDGERARAAILRLSRLMRYVLYESPAAQVRLSQEVSFLRDYIELMRLRLTASVQVRVVMPDPLPFDPLLAPLLFQPFVENAFKHGVSATAPSFISIELRQPTARTVELRVRNTRFAARPAAPAAAEPGGIGLANTRRRLALLYPAAHELTVAETTPENEYAVCLTLHL